MISENKLRHSLGVARICQQYGRDRGLDEEYCDALFVMGFLHDIGYEKSPDTNHPSVSFDMISSFTKHPEMLEAIRVHGKKYENLSVVDEILNMADLTVSYNGEPCTVWSRLEGIKEHCGVDSDHYKNAMLIVNALGLNEGL